MNRDNGLMVDIRQSAPIPLDARFTCAPGETLALVGPSGSGKSTILRTIAGILGTAEGRIKVGSETWVDRQKGVCLPAHRRAVGMVFQDYALFPHLSAECNIIAAMNHIPPADRKPRAQALLDLVHLGSLEDRKPHELSGGQQQRVAVARALARDPQVLLLDEPFSAVDRSTRQRLYREIADLRRVLDMPVVLVTHDLDEAVMLADRMAVLHHGRILQTGPPDQVMNRPVSPQVARLVDVRNVFEGRIKIEPGENGGGIVKWSGLELRVTRISEFDSGQKVSWIIPDGYIVLHRRDRPSRGEHENPVAGHVESILVMGQMAHITLVPAHDASLPLHFAVPAHVAKRNNIAPGVQASVSLLADGIHIMTKNSDTS